ncbi:hypothetical protein [uncultured Treponema sp.]|uniref:hypothetical protein n=1 Tax=uncultured Treponema sp. TaxID=162155 RepID=UPI0025D916FB|nr:hypothetical protein [uncultured Treponema sp.]
MQENVAGLTGRCRKPCRKIFTYCQKDAASLMERYLHAVRKMPQALQKDFYILSERCRKPYGKIFTCCQEDAASLMERFLHTDRKMSQGL